MINPEEYRSSIENYLYACFTGDNQLERAMHYSLVSGGKRIRPVLCLEFCRICGGNTDDALPVACAVEMLHTYSLIHDDLPCMDNDDIRRGKLTCHAVFGETVATLAGDCLQAEAFGTICSARLPDRARARCCTLLAAAAGKSGICGGQLLDLCGGCTEQDLMQTDWQKTAALIAAACAMGAAAAGAESDTVKAAAIFGRRLGMAFQLRDDLLDNDGFVAVRGAEYCEKLAEYLTQYALEALDCFENTDYLRKFTAELAVRFT